MRIVTYMLVFFLVPYLSLAQNMVSGKVVDPLGFPVYKASVELNATDITTYTDNTGSFLLKSEKDFHWKIDIKSKGYKPESFFVLSAGNTGYIVLEYDADLKKLLDGSSSLYQKFYWNPWKKAILIPKSENLLANAIHFSN